MPSKETDLLIVGAGPTGIEAALYAKKLGLRVKVVEKGAHPGAGMRACAHLEMFSPSHYNYSPLGIELLHQAGRRSTAHGEYETWGSYLDNYLCPLAELGELDILFTTRVERIGRAKIERTDLLGANRQNFPFKAILADMSGRESCLRAERIIDCSGVLDRPLYMGEGRMPAINERAHFASIMHTPCDLMARDTRGKTWLVIGNTHGAALAVDQIRRAIEADDRTRLIFIDEQGRKPYLVNLKNDLFAKRVGFIKAANNFLDSDDPHVIIHEESTIQRIDPQDEGFLVTVKGPHGEVGIAADHIAACVGFGADTSLFDELQIHLCYASGSPMNTAAAMLNDTIDFRHTPWALGRESIQNPEPGFYILGSKSYGRNQGYSLHIGLGQIILAFQDITRNDNLDLYAVPADSPLPPEVRYVKPAEAHARIARKRLSSSEQKYKIIADNLQEVIFQTDLKQKITYLSPSWETLTGYPAKTYLGMHWQDLLHEEDRARGLAKCNAFMTCQTDDYHEELRVERSDGILRWVEVNAHVLVDWNGVAYGTIGSMLDITERINALEELRLKNRLLDQLAVTDALTGLYNRRHFDHQLELEIKRACRDKTPLTLAMCDIDYFKHYNDTYGHQLGDAALKQVARTIRNQCQRETDIVARFGGEEFVVILPGTDKKSACEILEAIRRGVANIGIEHRASEIAGHITISIGAVALDTALPDECISPEILLKRADDALYESKRKGRDQMNFCSYQRECREAP